MPDDKSDDLKRWQGRIALAKRYQEKYGNTSQIGGGPRWDTYVKALGGDFNSQQDLGPEAIDVNLVHSTARTVLPPLWLNEPYVTFRATTARYKTSGGEVDNIRRAEFAEAEVNYWLRELKVRENVVRPAVLDTEAMNHGYAYVGYTRKKEEIETSDGESTEPNPLIRIKAPFVQRISPKRVLLPPGFPNLEECPWICILWLKPLEDVKDRYGEEATEDLEATKSLGDDEDRAKISGELKDYLDDDDAKLVEVQQIWDKRTERIITLADQHDRELDNEAWSVEFEGYPLVNLTFIDVPDEYYGTPSIQFYYPQNKELNAARTAQRKRFNRSKSALIVTSDVPDEVRTAIADAKDSEVVVMPNTDGEDIRTKVYAIPPLMPDPNVMIHGEQAKKDVIELSGLSAEQRGGGDPNIESATASANVEKHAQIRASDKGDRVRSFYLDITRKLYMVLQQFPNEKRSRLIAGPVAGQLLTVEYTMDEIKGEFALEMDLSTTLSENPATRLTQAMTNYNLFRGDPLINPTTLIIDVMRAQNKPNPQQYLLELRDPRAEIEMMLQGLPVEPHERDQHEQHLEEHEVQAAQIEQQLGRVAPESNPGRKLRFTMALLLAHNNSHVRMLQQIAQAAGRQAGQPVAENVFRNQVSQRSGSETAAELGVASHRVSRQWTRLRGLRRADAAHPRRTDGERLEYGTQVPEPESAWRWHDDVFERHGVPCASARAGHR
jgi:hypothetical protein